ncbi:MAG: NAD-dependent epimerase/dehydratase family protein [Microthrixaceae bacterium]
MACSLGVHGEHEKMKVVVTGGAGFIGANLCRALIQTGEVDQILVLDDVSTGFWSNLDGVDVERVEGSILDISTLHDCVNGADSVVHLAARPSVPRSIAEPVPSHQANATGTMNVLEAARQAGNCQVVVSSSSSVYGANPTLPKHEDLAPRPMSPYAASKLAAESYTLAWQHSYGMPTLAFRFFNVFGPLQAAGHAYAAVVPAFISAALAGEPLVVHGDGTQTRDFTYVETVCNVLTDAVLRRVSSTEPTNLAFGTRTTLLEVIALLEELLDQKLTVQFTQTRAGDVPHSQAANERLRELFPNVQPVDLKTGLLATINWFMSLPAS